MINSRLIFALLASVIILGVLVTQTSLFDPLKNQCDSSFNDAKITFEKKFNAQVTLNANEKAQDSKTAAAFYKKWSLIPNPLDLIKLENAQYPLVLYAVTIQPATGAIPYVAICQNGSITNNPTQ